MKTLPLLAVLLLMLWTPAEGGVVNSFTDNNQGCPQFFFPNPAAQNQRIIPSILFGVDTTNYATICQVFRGTPRFATLYDKRRRIPVYSAYTFDPNIKSEGKVNRQWKTEPELHDHQALDKDYAAHTKDGSRGNEDYTRGHLYPLCYGEGKDGRQSTCILTNAAPQLDSHNKEWATQVEEPLRLEMKSKCKGKAYTVTGVVPSATWLPIKRGTQTVAEGLNVPSYFWTAYCCDGKTGGRVSGARLSKHKDVALRASGFMEKMSVFELESRLHSEYSALFGRMKKRKRGDTDAIIPYKLFGGIEGCGGRE